MKDAETNAEMKAAGTRVAEARIEAEVTGVGMMTDAARGATELQG
jgi:hypothetical protein